MQDQERQLKCTFSYVDNSASDVVTSQRVVRLFAIFHNRLTHHRYGQTDSQIARIGQLQFKESYEVKSIYQHLQIKHSNAPEHLHAAYRDCRPYGRRWHQQQVLR